jgi:imidazolonepropionase-like amidohydrolase
MVTRARRNATDVMGAAVSHRGAQLRAARARPQVLLPLLTCALLAWTQASADVSVSTTVIHAGSLLSIPGSHPSSNQTIVVHGRKIIAIESGRRSPEQLRLAPGTRVVDLSSHFVLPGLIDCHVHLTLAPTPARMLKAVTETDAQRAITAAVHAQRTLAAGFTTVRDLGSSGRAIFAVRDRILDGSIPGPQVVAAGSAITPTGGHGDANGYTEEVGEVLISPGVCDGVDDCRHAVREAIKYGADVIKVTATGGVMSMIDLGLDQQLSDEELQVIVGTAHALGRKVAAHAHEKAGIDAALRAGVDSIEHGTFADAASAALFRTTHAYFVPTQLTIGTVQRIIEPSNGYAEVVQQKAQRILPRMQTVLHEMHRAGVRIAFGTDAGVLPHGQNAGEFQYLVKAGLTPMQALQAATVNAALLLGLQAHIGTVEVGKEADIIAVPGNPLDDVAVLMKPSFVMYDGIVYSAPTDAPTTADSVR